MLSLVLGATADNIRTARHAVSDFLADHGCADDVLHDVRLAVSEACANVVLHAYDGLAEFEIDVTVRHPTAVITVRDHGRGLGAMSPGPHFGVGLRIMTEVADRIRFSEPPDGGTQVSLTFPTHGR